MRRSLVQVPVIVAVLTLSACFGTPSPSTTTPPPASSTRTPSATPSSTPTPAPAVTATPKAALASISATVDALTLVGADGSTLASLDYFQPKESAVAALTEALGFAPQELTKEGTPNSDHLPSNYLDFEGLEVLGPSSDGTAGWLFRVNITVASVRGVPVATVDGIQAGADAQALEAAYPQYARRIGSRLLIAIPGSTGYSASLFADDPNGTITSILVPAGG